MPKRPILPEEPDDAALLREALKDVAPLPDPGRVLHPPARRDPVAAQTRRDEQQVLQESLSGEMSIEAMLEAGEALAYLREGIDRQVLRKLRRAHWVVQDEIDLHGLRVVEARELLVAFLNEALRSGRRCVRIVHGKGLRSAERTPVLKKKVAGWLRQRDEVLAYCQAPPPDGGSGALLVLLKARRATG
ncbi:MAG TPA: Smr/MutS family protein [Burkholderiales bacterium]|jgi:DNA-nicking Smr family endonuclease|nr:Smr/MutS family protein [Burkholderiales bacterium]